MEPHSQPPLADLASSDSEVSPNPEGTRTLALTLATAPLTDLTPATISPNQGRIPRRTLLVRKTRPTRPRAKRPRRPSLSRTRRTIHHRSSPRIRIRLSPPPTTTSNVSRAPSRRAPTRQQSRSETPPTSVSTRLTSGSSSTTTRASRSMRDERRDQCRSRSDCYDHCAMRDDQRNDLRDTARHGVDLKKSGLPPVEIHIIATRRSEISL